MAVPGSSVEILLRRALLASTRTSGFDSLLGHPSLLWSLMSTLGFYSSLGWISELQGLRLLLSSQKGFDVCFGLPCTLWQVPSGLPGWGCAGTAGGHWHWQAPEAGSDGQPARRFAQAVLLSMNPVVPWYIYCSCSNTEFSKQWELQQGIWLVRRGPLKQCAGLKPGFLSIRRFRPILTSFLHHYYLLGRQ